MNDFSGLAKGLILLGMMSVIVGAGLLLADKIPFIGRLPGDISFQWKNVSVYVPLATCILISIVLTILLNLFSRR
ncbi:MAG: DUF2905 domain-containing protein [Candidatus Latescibacteria bacterium]|nr:DUF2905 domain-containing protein [Candidatus Latescibacterota bacterium]